MYVGGAAVLIVAVFLATENKAPEQPEFEKREYDRVLVVGVDLSLSFVEKMTGPDARAYRDLMRVVKTYSSGSREKLIIVQLSGNKKSLIWDGTPADLREQFKTPEAFRAFLLSKSDVNSSRLHDGITDALRYAESIHGIKPTTKCAAIFFSDMDENDSGPGHEERLKAALKSWADRGGIVGLYEVDSLLVPKYQAMIQAAGVRNFVVAGEHEVNPRLPTFE